MFMKHISGYKKFVFRM